MTAYGWRTAAACAGLADADVMYPEPGNKNAVREARTICAACPVAVACLEEALAIEGGRTKDSRFGVWAGKTPAQRYGIYQSRRPSADKPKRRGPGRSPSPCGTAAAYDRHCRLKEPIDDACRAAHKEKNRAARARQRGAEAEAVV